MVLAVRGTMRLHDVLTDLVCEHVALGGEAGGAGEAGEAGEAHAGMLEAAQRLLEQQRPLLEASLRLTLTRTLTLHLHPSPDPNLSPDPNPNPNPNLP